MNLNKALIAVLCLLSLLVIVTVINLNRSKNAQYGDVLTDIQLTADETLMANIHFVPDIV